LDSASAI